MATLDGLSVLGLAVHVQESPNANASMLVEFFGLNGQISLHGGTRGRTLMVDGVLYGRDIPSLNYAESLLENFADGRTHTLRDDRGRFWYNLIYNSEYTPSPDGPKPCDTLPGITGGGWIIPYRAVFHGLT